MSLGQLLIRHFLQCKRLWKESLGNICCYSGLCCDCNTDVTDVLTKKSLSFKWMITEVAWWRNGLWAALLLQKKSCEFESHDYKSWQKSLCSSPQSKNLHLMRLSLQIIERDQFYDFALNDQHLSFATDVWLFLKAFCRELLDVNWSWEFCQCLLLPNSLDRDPHDYSQY